MSDMLKKVEQLISENNLFGEVVDYFEGSTMKRISVEISGDWKHDHLRFENLADKVFEGLMAIREETIGNFESDYYTAIHTLYIYG